MNAKLILRPIVLLIKQKPQQPITESNLSDRTESNKL